MSNESKRGRPSMYTDQIADEICKSLAAGQSLNAICKAKHMPSEMTVRTWAREIEAFTSKYTRARDLQAERFADELIDLADTANADNYNAIRLKVDTRKWVVSKILPKKYGDKLQHTGADGEGPVQVEFKRIGSK